MPMSWVAGQQPWWHSGVPRMLLRHSGPGTRCRAAAASSTAAPNPLVSSCWHWGSSAPLLPTAVGTGSPSWTAGTRFCSLPWSAAGPHSSSGTAIISGHTWVPRARSRCCGHPEKVSEVELNVARGFTMVQQPRVRLRGPHVSPPEAGAVPQPAAEQDGCPGTALGGSGAGGCSPGVRAGGDRHHGGTTGGHRRAEKRGQRGGRTRGRGAAPSYLSPEQAAGLMLFWPGVKE